jgi:hypothetical protein
MMAPGVFEQLVGLRQTELLKEVAADQLALAAQSGAPGLRRRLAGTLYWLAAKLYAGVSEARVGVVGRGGMRDGVRAILTSQGVEYWRPGTMPLRH